MQKQSRDTKKEYLLKKNIKKINKDNVIWKIYCVGGKNDENLIAEENKYKQTILSYKTDENILCISGRENPKKTAKLIVETEYNRRAKSSRFKASTTAIAYILDPYILEELLIKYDWIKHFIVVFPSVNYFITLLGLYDFSNIIQNKAFKPVLSNNLADVNNILTAALSNSSFMHSGLMFFSYSPFARLYKDLFIKTKLVVEEVTNLMQVNYNTYFKLGSEMDTNIIRNLDKIIKYPTVKVLKDKLKGKPIVCVSAGPSLQKHFKFLKKIQDDVFIIAIAATAEVLLKQGIKPDLITIIDMQPIVLDQLKGINVSGIPIVKEMSCHYSVAEEVDTDFIFSLSPVASKNFLLKILEALGMQVSTEDYVSSGLTVAITSLLCAARLGASEIILIGQDLAVADNKSHVEGYKQGFDIEIIENLDGSKILKQTYLGDGDSDVIYTKVHEVKGFYGGEAYTTQAFKAFIDFFKDTIKGNNLENVYNATEGGAYIEGCEHITLKEAYNRFIKDNKLTKNKVSISSRRRVSKKELKEYKNKMQSIIDRMQEASMIAKEGLGLIQEFMKRYKKKYKEYFDEVWLKVSVEKINNLANRLNTEYVYEVNAIAQLCDANYYIFNLLNNINNSHYSEEALQADMQNKFVLFFSNIHEGLTILVNELNKVVEKIDKENFKNKKGEKNV